MKRIAVASCDAKFYALGRELIESVLRTSADAVREFVFFDLGLTAEQRGEMERMDAVRVVEYPGWLREVYADFLTPRMFAWKTYALKAAADFGESILYMDCGCVALHSLEPVFERMEREGAFLVQDVHRNDERTHAACFEIMAATATEREAMQIDAGVMGYLAEGPYRRIFEEGFEYAKNRACIFGEPAVHRHDQSIYSVLAERHGFRGMVPYGREVHWKGIESREQILWQHRGKWPAFKRLKERGEQVEPGKRVALYGAGKHTGRFLATFQNVLEPRHRVVGIVDDMPRVTEIEGTPVVGTEQWNALQAEVVIVSSDAHEVAMLTRARGVFRDAEVWEMYTEG